MIIGAEIGLLIYGIIAMIRGQYSMGKGKKVIGSKARLLAAVCMVPIPLSMIAGFLVGFVIELFIPGSTIRQTKPSQGNLDRYLSLTGQRGFLWVKNRSLHAEPTIIPVLSGPLGRCKSGFIYSQGP